MKRNKLATKGLNAAIRFRPLFFIALLTGVAISWFAVGCSEKEETKLPALAWINGQPITEKELESELGKVLDPELRPEFQSPEWNHLKGRILQQLVEKKLLLLEAARRGVTISDEEFDAAIAEVTQGLPGEELRTQMEHPDWNSGAAMERIKEKLVIDKLFREEIFPRILVSDSEIEQAYKEDPSKYKRPERRRVRQIVCPDEIIADKAYKEIKKGGKADLESRFAKAAGKYSIAPEKERGGDLGWVERGHFPEEIEKLIFSAKIGRLGKAEKSSFGYHLFLVTDKVDKGLLSLDKARPTITMELYEKKKDKARKDLMQRAASTYRLRWSDKARQENLVPEYETTEESI